MFSNSPSKPILPPRYSDLLLTTHLLPQDLFSFDISSDILCSAFSQLHLLNPYFFPSRPLDPDILPILTFIYISGNSSWTQFISMFQGTSRSRSAQRIQGLSVKHISWLALRIATIPWQRPFHWLWCEHFEECRKRQAGIYKEGGIAISRKRCRRSKSRWELLFLNSSQTISKKHRKILNWGEITDWRLVYYCNEAFFTRAKFLENKIYTEKRQFFALNL